MDASLVTLGRAVVDAALVAEGRAEARKFRAEAELLRALKSGDAVQIEQACGLAEGAGLNASTVSWGRAEARRLQAETDLQEALQHGDAARLEEACRRAEDAGVDTATVSRARSIVEDPRGLGPAAAQQHQ